MCEIGGWVLERGENTSVWHGDMSLQASCLSLFTPLPWAQPAISMAAIAAAVADSPACSIYISLWFLLMQTPLISDTGNIRSELIKSSLWDRAHVAPAGRRCDVPCPWGCCMYVTAAVLSPRPAKNSCTEFSLFASSHPCSASC